MPLPQLLSLTELLPEFRELQQNVPGPGRRCVVGGLHGSSDAVLLAALAASLHQRFFVVVSDDIADAERWLADLTTLVEPDGVAFYPPRESFGEAEAHAEIAGERVETLERIGRGDLRIVVTTSRAVLERTQLPRALASARWSRRGRRSVRSSHPPPFSWWRREPICGPRWSGPGLRPSITSTWLVDAERIRRVVTSCSSRQRLRSPQLARSEHWTCQARK